MIKCGRCGNLNAGDVLFCQYCGTRLVEQRLPESLSVAGRPSASNRSTDRLSSRAPIAGRAVPRTPGIPRPRRPCPLAAAVRVVASSRPAFAWWSSTATAPTASPTTCSATRSTSAGPRATCCSRIPHLAPRHARIVASLTGRVLTPLETRNGVYVRLRGPGRPAGRRLYAAGQAGAALRARPRRRAERCAPPSSTAWSCSGRPCGRPGRGCARSRPPGVGRDVFHLTRPEIVLGRETGDIVFSDDEFMSRRHAQIVLPQRARASGGPGQLERHVPAPARTARPGLGRPHPIGRRAVAVRDRMSELDSPPDALRPPPDITIEVFGKTDVGLIREHNEDNFLVADVTGAVRAADAARPASLQAGRKGRAAAGVRRDGRRGGGRGGLPDGGRFDLRRARRRPSRSRATASRALVRRAVQQRQRADLHPVARQPERARHGHHLHGGRRWSTTRWSSRRSATRAATSCATASWRR